MRWPHHTLFLFLSCLSIHFLSAPFCAPDLLPSTIKLFLCFISNSRSRLHCLVCRSICLRDLLPIIYYILPCSPVVRRYRSLLTTLYSHLSLSFISLSLFLAVSFHYSSSSLPWDLFRQFSPIYLWFYSFSVITLFLCPRYFYVSFWPCV